MCGIVGAIAQRNVVPILIEGLKRLEYRGYDSAGLAVIDNQKLSRRRALGKVVGLEALIEQEPIEGSIGIAHTRWATHGKPSTENAHPHICREEVGVVHNGIIENHVQLRNQQKTLGYHFSSETDTEVIVNQIHIELQKADNLLIAVKNTLSQLDGAYALAVVAQDYPDRLIVCRKGSPLVIGIGIGEWFIASDVAALLPVTQHFIFLEEGDIAELTLEKVVIYDKNNQPVERASVE
ncbi:MAG: glutamine--fructose-6-phosphate aminotransferase, partial [Methylococcaceae bacterium]|nr:glutamine--fructose-6-phosphate aminotransferase [Methylococcaceae bacterium]